ncbi:MAG TPA: RNA polymerase sigma factor [Solirubrobacteraceae bacterium]|nr:RNA polymerase sigma factor [Solirubrobacteraceae bacterium]
MEASAIPATVGLARPRTVIGAPLLRIRSDEQLVSMFRSGNEDAFRAIHDRYRARMFAYTRQMLSGSAADAEDAVQEIFVRAYAGLRASRRQLALRAWLYRIAHNRCIDELRRPQMVPTEQIPDAAAGSGPDPVAQTEQRDALRRLIVDVGRLPEQQRSALLMRELGGMTYADVAGALGVSVPAVKSLLVRARVGLAQANEARDTACAEIREDLILSHDRGVRTSGLARRHMRDCPGCRQFRREVRGVSHQLAALVPALGPIGIVAKLLGIGGAGGGGAAAGSGAVAGGGAATGAAAASGAATAGVASGAATAGVASGAAATGIVSSGAAAGSIAGAGHVVTLLAAAVVTAGGAIELQHISPPARPAVHHHRVVARPTTPPVTRAATAPAATGGVAVAGPEQPATTPSSPAVAEGTATPATSSAPAAPLTQTAHRRTAHAKLPLVERLDPDSLYYATVPPPGSTLPGSTTTLPTTTGGPTATPPAPGTAATGTPGATPGTATTGPGSTTSTPGSSTTGSTTATGTGTSTDGSSAQSPGQTTATGTGQSSGPSTGGSSPPASVTPADTTGSFNGGSGESGRTGKHRRTVAVFTMTGN